MTDLDIFQGAMPVRRTSIRERGQRVEIANTIKLFAEVPAPINAQHVRKLIEFEDSLYPVIQADKSWFFSNPVHPDALQFSRDLQLIHSLGAKTLQQLIERRGEWCKGDGDPLLVQCIAIALFHHAAALKWRFFRHEPAKPTIWKDLHALYVLAESTGCATAPLVLFEFEPQYRTSIQALYLRTLMLELLNTGNLTTIQIEIADGWLAEWTPEYLLESTWSPRAHALYANLDSMAGLQLVTGVRPQPSYRYLRADGLKGQIEAVRGQLRKGQPYHGRGPTTHFSVDEHVALLAAIERLHSTILQASASRIEERTPVENLAAEVAVGFANARAVLQVPGEPAPDPAGHVERWKVHDLSSKGMGLMVDRGAGERTAIGEILAVRAGGFRHFMLGVVVRRIIHRVSGETLLGVELLSYRPLPVLLALYNHPRDAEPDPVSAPVAAMYLPGPDPEGKRDILALPGTDFGLKNVFKLATRETAFRVRINRILRKGQDWVGLRFEVIGKKESDLF
ncbi:MAG TPA: hypothetical protein VFV17_09810 [Usitatibacteraceae bacterium]|nr:hypothetical protein [Usitatibacteraceae bacterium]